MAKKENEVDKELDSMQTDELVMEEEQGEDQSSSFVFPHMALQDGANDIFAPEDDEIEDMVNDIELSHMRAQVEDTKTLQALENSVYGQKGAYGKLYSISLSGEATFQTKVRDLAKVADDAEEYVSKLIKQNADWPGGHWMLRVYDSKHKLRRSIDMHFAPKPNVPSSSSDAVAVGALKQSADMLDKFIQITQQNKQDFTPTLLEFLKESKEKGNDTESFIKMLAIMKEMNQPKQTNNELMTALVTVGIPVVGKILENVMRPRKEPDMIETIRMLKDMTGDKPENSFNSALGMFNRIMETVQGMQPPAGNPWSEAIRQMMPHVGEVLGNVSGTFKELAQAKREAIALQAGSLHGRRELPAPAASTIPEGDMPISSVKQTEDTASMHPIMKKVYDAVMTNDVSFYPELENIIENNVPDGDQIVEGLVFGTIPVDGFVDNIAGQVPQFNSPEMKARMVQYIHGFATKRFEEYEASKIVTECSLCENRVEFPSMQHYNDDEDHGICGKNGCKGQLGIIQESPEAIEEVPAEVKEEVAST